MRALVIFGDSIDPLIICPFCKTASYHIETDDYVGQNCLFWCENGDCPKLGEIMICPTGYNDKDNTFEKLQEGRQDYTDQCSFKLDNIDNDSLHALHALQSIQDLDLENYTVYSVGVLEILATSKNYSNTSQFLEICNMLTTHSAQCTRCKKYLGTDHEIVESIEHDVPALRSFKYMLEFLADCNLLPSERRILENAQEFIDYLLAEAEDKIPSNDCHYTKIDPPALAFRDIKCNTDHDGTYLYYKARCSECHKPYNNRIWGD